MHFSPFMKNLQYNQINVQPKNESNMEAKLISLQVMEAKNVVCAWRTDNNDRSRDFRCGIALDTACCKYMKPYLIAVGVFDDGSTKAAGMVDFGEFNRYSEDYDEMFIFNQFLYYLTLDVAKAFVRGLMLDGDCENEDDAKECIMEDMKETGVEISDDAMEFLTGKTKA